MRSSGVPRGCERSLVRCWQSAPRTRRRLAVVAAAGLLLWAAPAAEAQSTAAATPLLDSLRPVIERAMGAADWSTLEAAVLRLRREGRSAAGARSPWVQYDLAYALHRRASGLIVEQQPKDARALLEEAVAAAQRARELGAGAHALALEGAVTGQLAGVVGGLAVMRYGPRAFRLLDEAVDSLPNDPRTALLNGITRLSAPRAFGGGAARGEAELQRALQLFARDPNRSPQPVWGHVDAYIWLGIAFREQDRPAEARQAWGEALARMPGHRWVTDELLPSLRTR